MHPPPPPQKKKRRRRRRSVLDIHNGFPNTLWHLDEQHRIKKSPSTMNRLKSPYNPRIYISIPPIIWPNVYMIYVFRGLVPRKLPHKQSRKMHFVF